MIPILEFEPSKEQLQAEISSSRNCIECLKLQLEQAHRDAQATAATAAATAVERELLLASERESHAQLQADARLKDEFLANLSHELRTPIGAIQGWSQLIRPGESSAAELTEATRVIERSTRHLLRLIEDLLDMSRVVSGKMKIAAQEVDLVEIIRGAVESFGPAATAKHVTVQTAMDSATAMVSGDAARLSQVVWNLLSNAIKFTPENGSVHVELEHVNAHVELSIIDSGIGIAREFLPFVFDRFRQADCSSTKKQSGLGLGLAIVKSLVELHGGAVRVKSQGGGRGTTFTVVLPNSRAASQPDAHEPDTAPENLPALNDLHVLIVDDDTDGTDPLARVLCAAGAQVSSVGSALEALRLVKLQCPDVVLADISMPQIDGFEFARRVRALCREGLRDVPIAAVSALGRSCDRRRAMLAGFDIFLTKPVDPAELIAVIARLARRV